MRSTWFTSTGSRGPGQSGDQRHYQPIIFLTECRKPWLSVGNMGSVRVLALTPSEAIISVDQYVMQIVSNSPSSVSAAATVRTEPTFQ